MHNRFYVSDVLSDDLIGNEVDLPAILNHVKALRLESASEIELYDGSGALYNGIISSISKKNIKVKILSIEQFSEKSVKIHLFVPLIASNLMDVMIAKLAELDIYSIYPLITERCVRHIESPNFSSKLDRWKKISASSMILSGRNKMTGIASPVSFKDALSLCTTFDIKFMGAIASNKFLKNYLLEDLSFDSRGNNRERNNALEVAMFIGPEGDFSNEELKLAKEKSFTLVKLTNYIMSSFSAAIFSASVLVCFFG
jgi:16S rRNA (uracil1498-N3)-methyltransferase